MTTILATVWQNFTANSATPPPPSGLPSAQFYTTGINYLEPTDSTTRSTASFFNNPSFFNPANGFNSAVMINNTFTQFSGSVWLTAGANTFVVAHDDGLVLTFTDPSIGTVVSQPGPTSAVSTPFAVIAPSTGFFAFSLYYNECMGGPAQLTWTINDAPVGATDGQYMFVTCT